MHPNGAVCFHVLQTDSLCNRIISIAGQRRLAPQILKLTEELSRAE